MIRAILILFICSSCSNFLSFFKEENLNKELKFINKINDVTCGPLKNKINVVHDSKYTIDEFNKVSKRLINEYQFTFPELVIAFMAYQQIVRPDASNSNSRLQFLINYKNKSKYFDLTHINKQSYKDFTQTIRNNYKVRSLKKIERILNTVIPRKVHIQQNFNNFLSKNLKSLMNDKVYKKFYKLNEPLLTGERFHRRNIRLAVSNDKKEYRPPTFSMNLPSPANKKLECSFDPGLYQNEIYILKKKVDLDNTFALQVNGHSLLAYSASVKDINQPHFPVPFCTYSDQSKKIALMGFGSRDPAQILYNLINYEIFSSKNSKDLVSYIDFPRHEILNNPNRIIFESKRSSEEQLNYFLSLTLPVYHSDAIGEVWSTFEDSKNIYFISDTRKPSFQSCIK